MEFNCFILFGWISVLWIDSNDTFWYCDDVFPQSLAVSEIKSTRVGQQKPNSKIWSFLFFIQFSFTVFAKLSSLWVYRWIINFTLQRGLKVAKILKFRIFGRHILNTRDSKTNHISKIQYPVEIIPDTSRVH